MKDDEEFKITQGALTVCQFSPDDQWNIWSIIAIVMHLGNIEFQETEKKNLPVAYVDNKQSLMQSAKMMQVRLIYIVPQLSSYPLMICSILYILILRCLVES